MASKTTFVDEAVVIATGGDGGNGVVSFLREKYNPKGGPNGGNGGAGGSVIMRANRGISTLAELARHPHQRAERGAHGMGDTQHGAAGGDKILLVPEGTIVRDEVTGEVLADLVAQPAELVAARGGKGGRGNASLSSARRRAPGFAERGEEGEERRLLLELRVLADVGLVGLPNAGKSSLIAQLSAARPAVAAYPFTTLTPHLGVSEVGDQRFVIADVPGLIEGAAEGRGLGHAFLKHLQRCLVLCYVIDVSLEDPSAALDALREELRAYDPLFLERHMVIAANKIDLGATAELPGSIEVSALNGAGVAELSDALSAAVEREKEARKDEPDAHALIKISPESDRVEILREDDAVFRVRSPKVERLIVRFDVGNADALSYIQERLVAMGVEHALERAGAKEGDEVRIGDVAFEFLPEHAS